MVDTVMASDKYEESEECDERNLPLMAAFVLLLAFIIMALLILVIVLSFQLCVKLHIIFHYNKYVMVREMLFHFFNKVKQEVK